MNIVMDIRAPIIVFRYPYRSLTKPLMKRPMTSPARAPFELFWSVDPSGLFEGDIYLQSALPIRRDTVLSSLGVQLSVLEVELWRLIETAEKCKIVSFHDQGT